MLNGEGIWLLFSLSDFYSREEVVCCWSGAYLESQVFRPPVATGAGSHIISLSFYKLFPLPVCTLKLSVDFWASLSANANPSELHTVPDRSFPVLGWWPWRTRPGRQWLTSHCWDHIAHPFGRGSGLLCCFPLVWVSVRAPSASCWCEGTQNVSARSCSSPRTAPGDVLDACRV